MAGQFATLHDKCFDGPSCSGPGCKRTRNHYSTAAPRVRDTLTRAQRKLQSRQDGFVNAGKTEMHKPGSQNWHK